MGDVTLHSILMALETGGYACLTIASPGNGKRVWVHKAQEQIPEANPTLVGGKWFLTVAHVLNFI